MKLVAVCSFLALAGAGAYIIYHWGREAVGLGKHFAVDIPPIGIGS